MAKNLFLHKNTMEKRRRKEIVSSLTGKMRKKLNEVDVRAYAVVCIDANGKGHCEWDTGSIMPIWGFAQTIHEVLKRDIEESGVDETWKPPLRVDG